MDNLFQTSSSEASADKKPEAGRSPSLAAGIAAMKRKDYPVAIAQLNAVAQSATDKATALKAQMTLVVAYQRMGDVESALAYCQPLCDSPNQQVQAWAMATLATLQQAVEPQNPHSNRSPEPNGTEINGTETNLEPDLTGFTPLNAHESLESDRPLEAEVDETGFVPLDRQTQSASMLTASIRENMAPSIHQSSHQSSADLAPDSAIAPDHSVTTNADHPSEAIAPESPVDPSLPTSAALQGSLISTIRRRSSPTSLKTPLATEKLTVEKPVPNPLVWHQAGRAQKWTSLGPVDIAPLWALDVGTAIAVVLVINLIFQGAIALANQLLGRVMWPIDLRVYVIYADPFWLSALLTIALFFLSPWLFDQILRRWYGAKSFRFDDLGHVSPEAVRVIKRICGQKRQPTPAIRIVPTPAPLAFTYGALPRNAKLVISQGLLDTLSDDEIATILVAEISHMVHWDFAIMSLVTLAAQLPYLMYWTMAKWGDRQHSPILRPVAVVLSSIGYSLFWLLRWVGLWLSRTRHYYSDRAAVETTGNPNGLTRALLKIAIGIDDAIQQQGYTSYLLEGFDLLAPVGYQTALAIGSAYPYSSLGTLLEWDRVNPYRRWLAINNAHPLMGDRLQRLAQYARHWRLEPELALSPSTQSTGLFSATTNRSRFWQQTAPFLGIVLGAAITCLLWLVGSFANRLNLPGLAWMQGDPSIFWGCLLTGFSLGTVLRINSFFPDITPRNLTIEPILADLLTPTASLPVDSQPVRLRGRLLGRSGMSNQLHQDLILQSDTGLIKLHYRSRVGHLGDLLPQHPRPITWVNAPVIVTGWFRRGATPWIDVDTLQLQQGQKIQSGHPIWSTLLAFLASLLAAFIILGGGQF